MAIRIALAFIDKTVSRATTSGSGGVATLNHEIGNDAVKRHAVVELVLRKKNEVVDRLGCVFHKEITNDFAAACRDGSGVFFLRVDRHRGRR